MSIDVISGRNLSEAWAKAFLAVARPKTRELLPLVVTVPTPFGVSEDERIRALLNHHLAECREYSIDTVSNTIFPQSLWNREQPRIQLFERYKRIWPKLRKIQDNRYGTYFQRLIEFREDQPVCQLEHVISTYHRGNHRRSALQLAIFDPTRDHVNNRQKGFPCLQQIALTPTGDSTLAITGFYATQTIFEKAYGNYLGLIRLGEFMAHEMGMKLSQMTCISAVAKLNQVEQFTERQAHICDELRRLLGKNGNV